MDITNLIQAKSDQLNADDLISSPITFTVQNVRTANTEQPLLIEIDKGFKPFKPCLSMRRLLAKFWGIDASAWIGQSITLYNEPTVKWAGQAVGGIRISHMTGLNKVEKVMLSVRKGMRQPYTVQPLIFAQPEVKPPYSDADLEKNSDAWVNAINSGKITTDKIIAKISQKNTLSDAQVEKIQLLSVSSANQEPQEPQEIDL